MPRQHTHEEFLSALKTRNKYYRNGEFKVIGQYVNNLAEILVEDKYGICSVIPRNLLVGQNININSAIDKCSYFKKMLLEKNDRYASGVFIVIGKYEKASKNIVVQDKYGYCKVTPNRLLQGKACNLKSAINRTEYFIAQAKSIHGDKYDYTNTRFVRSNLKIKIGCPIHGEFTQLANNHFPSGNGCPVCGDIACSKKNVEGSSSWKLSTWVNAAKSSNKFDSFKLYILQLERDGEVFFKVGRTYRRVDYRHKELKPYNCSVLYVTEGTAEDIFNLENIIKKENKLHRYTPQVKFHGSGECFTKVEYNGIRY